MVMTSKILPSSFLKYKVVIVIYSYPIVQQNVSLFLQSNCILALIGQPLGSSSICLPMPGLFHFTQQPPVPFMLWKLNDV